MLRFTGLSGPVLCLVATCLAFTSAAAHNNTTLVSGFTDRQISLVSANAQNVSNASWEVGTFAEALTELYWPSMAVFSGHAIPFPRKLTGLDNATNVVAIANTVISNKPPESLPLVADDGAVGDPASIGNAVLFANWTHVDPSNATFGDAARGQLQYLMEQAPRTQEGAISHRADQVQLWADFVYMAPPFIAYYGALQGGEDGKELLQAAYDQCRLYRDVLFDADASLWRHIAFGNFEDPSHWATGNGWAAAGMMRVLSTIAMSDAAGAMKPQQQNLTMWVHEILNGTWAHQDNGTLLNTLDDPASFADTSATALLAATTLRMAAHTNSSAHLDAASAALALVRQSIDDDGWLQGTVDPLTFNSPSAEGAHSPEGQSFVMMLQAAWSAWVTAGVVADMQAIEDAVADIEVI